DLVNAVDTVWVVDAAPETQLRRLIEKRGLSPEEARKRMAAQPPQHDKLRQAQHVIRNDGNVEETWRQVQAAWASVQRQLGQARARDAQPAMRVGQPAAPRQAASAPATPATAIQIRRGMPGNADLIARFISRASGKPVERMDVMLAFGQKSYLLAT